MNELNRMIAQASAQLDAAGLVGHDERLRQHVVKRVRQRQHARVWASGALVVALGGGLAWSALRPAEQPHESVAALRPQTQLLDDGSRIQRRHPSDVRVVRQTPELTQVQLARGSARFEVVRNPARRFVVEVENVQVEVVGTVFEVTRGGLDVEVRVHEGVVSVRAREQLATLTAGQAQRFALGQAVATGVGGAATSPQPASLQEPEPGEPHGTPPAVASAGEQGTDWRGLARAGKFTQAYVAMRASATPPRSSVEEMLLRADVARLSGHPAEAVAPLSELLSRHPADSRAPSASFTLGRVYEQLGRWADAARAFGKTRSLEPSGPLAEDALARQALALWAAGGKAQAEALGRQYLGRYPRGVRAQEIRARLDLP